MLKLSWFKVKKKNAPFLVEKVVKPQPGIN